MCLLPTFIIKKIITYQEWKKKQNSFTDLSREFWMNCTVFKYSFLIQFNELFCILNSNSGCHSRTSRTPVHLEQKQKKLVQFLNTSKLQRKPVWENRSVMIILWLLIQGLFVSCKSALITKEDYSQISLVLVCWGKALLAHNKVPSKMREKG